MTSLWLGLPCSCHNDMAVIGQIPRLIKTFVWIHGLLCETTVDAQHNPTTIKCGFTVNYDL